MTDGQNKTKASQRSGILNRLPIQHFVIGLMLLQFAPWISCAEPTPFRAVYKATYKGIPVAAEGIRELTQLSDGSYLLTNSVKSWLASVSEQSLFSWHPGDQLLVEEYQYHRRGIGRNRDAVLKFDWSIHQVLNDVQSKPWKMTIPDGVMDKLGYQIKMRSDLQHYYSQSTETPDLSYQIADGGRLKTYNFKTLGEEYIDTPVGRLNTVKIVRIRNNDKRSTIFWLAKDWDFLLVRLEQVKSGKNSFNLFLKKATVNGSEVRGS
jgi:hypothetical protein